MVDVAAVAVSQYPAATASEAKSTPAITFDQTGSCQIRFSHAFMAAQVTQKHRPEGVRKVAFRRSHSGVVAVDPSEPRQRFSGRAILVRFVYSDTSANQGIKANSHPGAMEERSGK